MISMGYHKEWLPFEFWEYTTVVMGRFFECEPAWDTGGGRMRVELRALEEDLIERFKDAGIHCAIDNKIAFGLKHSGTGQVVYIGFYDSKLSIGSWVHSDGWNKPHRAKTQE